MSNQNIQLAIRYYAALNARDFGAYDQIFSPNVEIEGVGGARGTGIEAVKAFDRVWVDGASNFKIHGIFHVGDGDRVVCHNRAEGIHDGVLRLPGGDVPATGRTIGGVYFAAFQIRAERIATALIYFDRMVIAEQLGVVPH